MDITSLPNLIEEYFPTAAQREFKNPLSPYRPTLPTALMKRHVMSPQIYTIKKPNQSKQKQKNIVRMRFWAVCRNHVMLVVSHTLVSGNTATHSFVAL